MPFGNKVLFTSYEKTGDRRYDIASKHPENFHKHYLSTNSNGCLLHIAFNKGPMRNLLHLPQVTG